LKKSDLKTGMIVRTEHNRFGVIELEENRIDFCYQPDFSDEYKIPFSMHVAGFKYHEIAEKMGLPLGTVKSRIFFARQRLQEILKDYK